MASRSRKHRRTGISELHVCTRLVQPEPALRNAGHNSSCYCKGVETSIRSRPRHPKIELIPQRGHASLIAPPATKWTADRSPKSRSSPVPLGGCAYTDSRAPRSNPCIACSAQAHGSTLSSAGERYRARRSDERRSRDSGLRDNSSARSGRRPAWATAAPAPRKPSMRLFQASQASLSASFRAAAARSAAMRTDLP